MRAWPIDAKAAWIRCLFLFIGFSGPESSKSVTAIAFPDRRSLAEKYRPFTASYLTAIDAVDRRKRSIRETAETALIADFVNV